MSSLIRHEIPPAIPQDPATALDTKGIDTPLQVTIQCPCQSHAVRLDAQAIYRFESLPASIAINNAIFISVLSESITQEQDQSVEGLPGKTHPCYAQHITFAEEILVTSTSSPHVRVVSSSKPSYNWTNVLAQKTLSPRGSAFSCNTSRPNAKTSSVFESMVSLCSGFDVANRCSATTWDNNFPKYPVPASVEK